MADPVQAAIYCRKRRVTTKDHPNRTKLLISQEFLGRDGGDMSRDHEEQPCPTCGAAVGEQCVTISGNWASQSHLARWCPPGSYRERRVHAPYRTTATADKRPAEG